MNVRTAFWTLTVIIMIAVVAFNARSQFKSAQNNQKERVIEDAYIKIISPELEKKTLNEKYLKESLGESAEKVSVYGVFFRKTEYSVIYVKYNSDFDIAQTADKVTSIFSPFDFQGETSGTLNKLTISGTFKRNSQTYGVEAVLYKRSRNSWQVLTVFPISEDNLNTARNFTNSAVIDPSEKLPETGSEPSK